MMAKRRSLHAQINYCITQSCKIGCSKRADRKNSIDTTENIYSVQTAENLRSTADSICRFVKQMYPELKMIKDIKCEHIQEYIDYHQKQWSDRTLDEHISRINKLQKIVSREYGIQLKWDEVTIPLCEHSHKVRDKAVNRDDLEHIKADLNEDIRRENALRAIEIASRCGLRSKEIARLKYDNIDIEHKCIHVIEGSKGGKHRDVPIRTKDIDYFSQLKSAKDYEYVTHGIKEESLNRTIRRSMERLGINEKYNKSTVHAIRKFYASERFFEEKKNGLTNRNAWEKVQQELGHGSRYREELYKAYVK